MRKIVKLEPYLPIEKIFELFANEEESVILESSLKNKLGRFSIIARKPYQKIMKKNNELWINNEKKEEDFAVFLKKYLTDNKEPNPTKLPIVDGCIGFFSYDYKADISDLPQCLLIFYDQLIIEDHKHNFVYIIANGKLQDSEQTILELEEIIKNRQESHEVFSITTHPIVTMNFEKEEYKQAIKQMINHIIEGDIYIANMTQRISIKSNRKPYEVYKRLMEKNPAPFSAYMNYQGLQIISASPERFLKMKNRKITTRPIKGTRKRGKTEQEDEVLKEELKNSEKDKSELLMIVDLERNDLNRVCVPGTVKVDELFSVESYATVHHLVSSISGVLEPNLTAVDLIEATFPGGSITGAPKISAMEIIDKLERGSRGLYTGSIGYISLNGDCDFNIVIRTAIYQNDTYQLGVGGGITYESDLEFEYEETLQKAKAILEALS